MKISVVTVVYNNADTIADAVRSVLEQDHAELEHVVIDGASTDGTLEALAPYREGIAHLVSEPDDGIYDAMNKGIRSSSGEIVGFLNADDMFLHPGVVSRIAREFEESGADTTFGDLVYVEPENTDRVIRYYRSDKFRPRRLAWGWMPPHPTFYARRACFERVGCFKTDYAIAADYELVIRFLLKHGLSYSYIPETLIKMRAGGVSSRNLKSNWILNQEIIRGCRENGIGTNHFMVWSKYFRKVFQLVDRPAP